MNKAKVKNFPNVLPALFVFGIVLAVVAVSFYLVNAFSGGAPDTVIENFHGDYINEAGDVQSESLGGVTFEKEVFPNGLEAKAITYGGVITISSGSLAVTTGQLCDNAIINFDGDGFASAAAYRFPTATALINRCLPNQGDTKEVLLWNSSVDEVFSLTYGTGMDTWIASSSANAASDLFDNVDTDAGVFIRFMNFDGASVSLMFEEVRDSD
jgi:hypothetical protein|tara:strand:+ start:4234 stop:4869 length:636 start_codon:yes stop_codon:yes gene_type:complete